MSTVDLTVVESIHRGLSDIVEEGCAALNTERRPFLYALATQKNSKSHFALMRPILPWLPTTI